MRRPWGTKRVRQAWTVVAALAAVGLFVATDAVAAFHTPPSLDLPRLSTAVGSAPSVRSPGGDPSPHAPRVVARVPVGYVPQGIAYDARGGAVFVASRASVSVINDTVDAVVATIPVGAGSTGMPEGAAYDPANNEVFVANSDGNVTVVDASSDTVLKNISVGSDPIGVAYDPPQGEVYVTNGCVALPCGFGAVTVLNTTNDSVVTTIVPVGSAPVAAVYDSRKGEVFVSNHNSASVTVINATSNWVVATVSDGSVSYPEGLAYDPAQGEVFVANNGAGDVAVINDSENAVVAVVPISSGSTFGSSPQGVAYDASSGEVFVTAGYPSRVIVISSTTDKVVASVPFAGGPVGALYDPAKGEVFVAGCSGSFCTGNISVLSFVRSSYQLTFRERNLPPGTIWWVNVTGSPTVRSTGTKLTVYEPPGLYSYVVGTANKSWATPSGTLSLGLRPGSRTVNFLRETFPVTFSETGLPKASKWCMAISDGRTYCTRKTSVTFLDPNGTYSYTFSTTRSDYSAPGGSFTVSGAAVSRIVVFSTTS